MKTKNPIALLISWLALALGPTPAMSAADASQPSATGIVTGRVSNQATGDLLPGAIVQVEGRSISVSTDRDGYFSLSVPAGERTLLVHFTGLDVARVPVTVEPGRRIERDVPLTSEIYKLEKFSVTGIGEGAARAIQLQRLAPNSKTVTATDTFGNPASNPGELLGRLAGVTTDIVGSEVRGLSIRGMGTGFTSLLVDGNQFALSGGGSVSRNYQIEQYGTGNIESVELTKAPTPDMDANAIGGYVNLISKRAFDRPGRQINLTVGTNWRLSHYDSNPSKDRPDNLDLIVLDFSQAYDFLGGKKNLGLSFNFSRRVASTLAEEYGGSLIGSGSGLNYTNPNEPLATVFAAGFFEYPDYVNYNAGLNVDYKFSERTVGYVRTTFNKNSYAQAGYQWQAVTPNSLASFQPGSTYAYSRTLQLPGTIAESVALPLPKYSQNWSLNSGIEHKMFDGSGKLNIDAAFSHALIWYPANIEMRSEVTGIAWEVDRRGRDPWTPAFNQLSGPSVYEAANYTPTTWYKWTSNAPSDHGSLRLDFRKDMSLPVPTYIKTGVKYSRTKFTFFGDTGSRTYAGSDGLLASGDEKGIQRFLAGLYKLGGGRYGPFPMLQIPEFGGAGDISKLPANNWVQTPRQAYDDVVSSIGGDVSMTETLRAAYISGHITLGKLGILAGLRFEDVRSEGTSFARATDSTGSFLATASAAENVARATRLFRNGESTTKGQQQGVFPGLHFVYEPISSLLIRASYNNSISRPPITNLLPRLTINEIGTISQGNPNLKPYRSNNFEASVEKYFEPVGMVSVGVFLKEISDYFRTFQTAVPAGDDNGFNGQYAGYTLSQVQNAGNARIRGFELRYQQQYSFLPGCLKGFGSYANFTYQQTQGTYGGTTFQRRLAGFAPRSLNAGISYVQYGLQARLLLNWLDGFYRGGSGASATYTDDRRIIDLKLQYSIRPSYDVFLDVGNLFDEANTTIVVEGDRKYYRQVQGVSFSAGIKARF